MSEPTIARFPHNALPDRDHNAHAAKKARERIAALPDPYLEHATPAKEHLVGEIKPVSPAAEADGEKGEIKAPQARAKIEAIDAPPVTAATAAGAATNPLATPKEPIEALDATSTGPTPPTPKRSLPSRLRPLLIGLGTFVVLYFVFKPELLLSQLDYLTHHKTTSTPAAPAAAAIPAAPTISIPKISVNAPVVYATSNDENAILTDLQSGVVHYANTALPGQPGNSVIFGHSSNDWWEPGNYKFVFVLLDKLVPGDTFSVNYNAHRYIYQVASTTVVDPTDVAVLNQTPDPEMTLITCSPPGTSWKRLVVVAKQISPSPTAATSPATSGAAKSNGTLPSNAPSLNDELGSWWKGVKNFLTGGSDKKSTPTPTTTTPGAPTTLPATQ